MAEALKGRCLYVSAQLHIAVFCSQQPPLLWQTVEALRKVGNFKFSWGLSLSLSLSKVFNKFCPHLLLSSRSLSISLIFLPPKPPSKPFKYLEWNHDQTATNNGFFFFLNLWLDPSLFSHLDVSVVKIFLTNFIADQKKYLPIHIQTIFSVTRCPD